MGKHFPPGLAIKSPAVTSCSLSFSRRSRFPTIRKKLFLLGMTVIFRAERLGRNAVQIRIYFSLPAYFSPSSFVINPALSDQINSAGISSINIALLFSSNLLCFHLFLFPDLPLLRFPVFSHWPLLHAPVSINNPLQFQLHFDHFNGTNPSFSYRDAPSAWRRAGASNTQPARFLNQHPYQFFCMPAPWYPCTV